MIVVSCEIRCHNPPDEVVVGVIFVGDRGSIRQDSLGLEGLEFRI